MICSEGLLRGMAPFAVINRTLKFLDNYKQDGETWRSISSPMSKVHRLNLYIERRGIKAHDKLSTAGMDLKSFYRAVRVYTKVYAHQKLNKKK
jgi:hypothetical protein